MTRWTLFSLAFAVAVVFSSPAIASAQKAKVQRSVSAEQLEGILKDLGITAKKTSGATAGVFFYDFTRNNFRIRVQNFNGNDLWIDAYFAKIPLDEINRWNRQTRLSRAVLVANPATADDSLSLEAQLDCAGGVTEGMVRQFILGFDKEVAGFSAFLRGSVQEEEEIKNLSAARLEKFLQSINIQFKKTGTDKDLQFELTKTNRTLRLTCHEGNILVVRATCPKMPLEKINKYNVDRRFVRAFLDSEKDGKEFTVLEAYLDCRGGVTESILRYFFRTFDDELKELDRWSTI